MALLFTLPRVSTIDLVGEVAGSATLEFYQTLTSTPKAVYSDAALSVSLGVTVSASDAGLFPAIYLDTSTSDYKVICKDSGGSELWSVDPYSFALLSQATIGALLYPRSQAEISAGVTPINYFYNYGNVLRYGTNTTPGVTDMTSAFETALSTGYKVFIPRGDYLVTNINLVDHAWIEGEGDILSGETVLFVGTSNAGAFRHASGDRFFCTFKNLRVGAASGVIGARFFLQSDKASYAANFRFEKIATDLSLAVSYDGFFIDAHWVDCVDGYSGSVGAQGHQAISSIPAAFGQQNPTNLNRVVRSRFFGALAGTGSYAASVDIAYGSAWSFDGVWFENMDLPAIRARGILLLQIDNNCWFENIRAANMWIIGDSPAPSAQGCRNTLIANCTCVPIDFTGTELAGISGAAFVTFENISVQQIPASVQLAANAVGANIVRIQNVQALSGSGAAGFLGTLPVDTDNTFTGTFTGVDAVVTGTVYYQRRGREVTLLIPSLTGTSNAATCTITGMPAALYPARIQGNHLVTVTDNGSQAVGIIQLNASGVLTVYRSITATGSDWTASGTKAVDATNVTYLTV